MNMIVIMKLINNRQMIIMMTNLVLNKRMYK